MTLDELTPAQEEAVREEGLDIKTDGQDRSGSDSPNEDAETAQPSEKAV
jgi:hypothetical protein